jgi:isoamyl acetate esterase
MKNHLTTLTLSLLCLFLMSLQQANPTKVILFGDSITQAGVSPMGYITKMKAMIEQQGKKDQYELIGAGIGGNKIYDLYLRMDDDVLAKKPNIVVIYIGVNDVWHKRTSGTGTDADKFEKFYNAVIKKIKAQGAKVILCTPAAIGERTDFSNEQDGELNRYANIIRGIAKQNDCPLVDLRKAFLDYNLQNNPENKEKEILTTDRVHLNEKGNQLVADLILKEILK